MKSRGSPAQLKVLVHQLGQGGPVSGLQGNPEDRTGSRSTLQAAFGFSDPPGLIGELGERPHRLDDQRFSWGDTGSVHTEQRT